MGLKKLYAFKMEKQKQRQRYFKLNLYSTGDYYFVVGNFTHEPGKAFLQ